MFSRLLALAFAAMSSAAFAADLPPASPQRAPAAIPPVFTWSGFYLGGNLGDVVDNRNRITGTYPLFKPILGAGVQQLDFGNRSDGFTGGAQLGYNYQFGQGQGVVLGVETDMAYTDLTKRSTVSTGIVPAGSSVTYRTDLSAIGTVRARLGYGYGPLLAYGTGGFAYGISNRHMRLATSTGTQLAAVNLDGFEAGFVVGGGIEYAVPSQWLASMAGTGAVTLGAEYLHYQLHVDSRPLTVLGTIYDMHLRDSGDLIRARVNYKF